MKELVNQTELEYRFHVAKEEVVKAMVKNHKNSIVLASDARTKLVMGVNGHCYAIDQETNNRNEILNLEGLINCFAEITDHFKKAMYGHLDPNDEIVVTYSKHNYMLDAGSFIEHIESLAFRGEHDELQ